MGGAFAAWTGGRSVFRNDRAGHTGHGWLFWRADNFYYKKGKNNDRKKSKKRKPEEDGHPFPVLITAVQINIDVPFITAILQTSRDFFPAER